MEGDCCSCGSAGARSTPRSGSGGVKEGGGREVWRRVGVGGGGSVWCRWEGENDKIAEIN